MNPLDLLSAIPKAFDWYLAIPDIKRMHVNYITIIALILGYSFYKGENHAKDITVLSARIDTINNYRAKEQEKYTGKLEYYTDKFNSLNILLLEQKKEIKQIKEEQ